MEVTCVAIIFSCTLLFYLIGNRLGPVSGSLQTHSLVRTAAGGDAVLTCHSSYHLSHVHMMVEWTWLHNITPKIVFAVRNGKELVKDQAPEYRGRSSLMGNGSLNLSKVQPQDSGIYRCLTMDESRQTEEGFSILIVAEAPTMNLEVERISADEVLVRCDTSGWSHKPSVTLAGPPGAGSPERKIEDSPQVNGLYSVKALVKTAEESGVWTCKAELPGLGVVKANTLVVMDPKQTGPCTYWTLAIMVLVFVLFYTIVFLPLKRIQFLRSLRQYLPAGPSQKGQEKEPLSGNISEVDTTGASDLTAKTYRLESNGIDASSELASKHLESMLRYKDSMKKVGKNLGIQPALIAAIVSRQSEAGTTLNKSGYGIFDTSSYGLMQINRAYHAIKGGPFSEEHLDQGATFLIQLIKTMQRTKPQWTKEQQLKGALACFIAGEERVIPLSYDELDSVTPNEDFANDVIARAQWFAKAGF